MRVNGPYTHTTGRLKGRRYVNIIKDDGSKTSKLYSRYLMEQHLGRELQYDETVDHINEDFTDDRLQNLQVITRVENTVRSKLGRPSPLKGKELGFTHGTMYAWMKKKCRCDTCRPAWRQWNDARNADRRKPL